MQKLIPALMVLAACSGKPKYTPAQEKIIKLAQHQQADSARYVPLRFSKPESFTNLDSVDQERRAYSETMAALTERANATAKLAEWAEADHLPADEVRHYMQEADEAKEIMDKAFTRQNDALSHSTHVVIGERISHIWRVGDKVDSADFVVYKTGKVQRLKPAASSL